MELGFEVYNKKVDKNGNKVIAEDTLDKRRTYKDIMNGVHAYTEDVFYRIKKIHSASKVMIV